MKYHKFASVFDADPAELALLSSFNFDADFFERRLMRSSSLAKARRIAVFMDHGQWQQLTRADVLARWLNQRYLVVPIRRPNGVFHPKLNLLISDKGCRISCGSGNLTRSGCTQNLELINSVSFDTANESKNDLHPLVHSALRFFTAACKEAEGEAGEIAAEWISDIKKECRWLDNEDALPPGLGPLPVNLFHNYDGPLWGRLAEALDDDPPKKFFVISPYYDPNAEMIRRIQKKWPKCKLEIVAQQGTSNLPISAIKRLRLNPSLFDVHNSSRRLHAKLLAWETRNGTGCLTGSANFTSAALDGRNAEACLYLSNADAAVDALFDSTLRKKKVSISSFEPGAEQEPEPTDEQPVLSLDSAVLSNDTRLRIVFSHNLDPAPIELSLNLRCASESHARVSKRVSAKATDKSEINIPENVFADMRGALLASLVAQTGDLRVESAAVWVILEDKLTHEPSDGSGGGSENKIRDSGDGLPEYLDEIGQRGGVSAIVEYLNHLNIRFFDGTKGLRRGRHFRLRRSDPFHPDVLPEWWEKGIQQADDLEEAIYEFAKRHENTRLRKHAERGNVNGIDNFLDIFTAIIRLMYVYYRRQRPTKKQPGDRSYVIASDQDSESRIVKKGRLIGQIVKCVQIATLGFEDSNDSSEGYLDWLAYNLRGDPELLREVCEEANFAGHVRAAFLIAQVLRFDPDEKALYGPPAKKPTDCLATWSEPMYEAFDLAGLEYPTKKNVADALDQYRMFTEDEIAKLTAELE